MKSLITSMMSNNIFFTTVFAILSFFALAGLGQTHAADYTETTMNNWTAPAHQPAWPSVVHGAPPEVRSGWDMHNVQTGQMTGMTVHAQNVSPVGFTTTICAEQWTNGVKHHIGCVPEAPFTNASHGVSRFDFNVWPHANMSGNHTMVFTYRDSTGNWREILSPTYQAHHPTIGT